MSGLLVNMMPRTYRKKFVENPESNYETDSLCCIDSSVINRKSVESLVNSGACDGFAFVNTTTSNATGIIQLVNAVVINLQHLLCNVAR